MRLRKGYLLALGALFLVHSNCKKKETDEDETAEKGGGKTKSVRLSGTYKSKWGKSVFKKQGDTVRVTYPKGAMHCDIEGKVLDCTWQQGSTKGKAKLTRQANGNIKGTWGNGASSTDGGSWNFKRISDSTKIEVEDFSGVYISTWGNTSFLQNGNQVTARYPGGKLTCIATGKVLNCDWREGYSYGKARLTKKPDGKIIGTWGRRGNSSNGGPWRFVPLR